MPVSSTNDSWLAVSQRRIGDDEQNDSWGSEPSGAWQTDWMVPRSSRVLAVLCALGLVVASCSSGGDDTAEVEADVGSTEADASTGGDAEAEAAESSVAGELGDQFGSVTVVGNALEAMPPQVSVTQADDDPAVGVVAPDVTGTSFDGTPVAITADGTPRVIMFVAHWCPHCQREIPAVKALIDAGAVPEGLEIVVVSTAVREGESNYPPQTWLATEAWPGPVLRDSAEFEALFAFGAGGFPFTVYLDSEHRVVSRSAGELPEDVLRQLWLATAEA